MPYVIYNPKERDTASYGSAPATLRLMCEGFRMEFLPYKPSQISDPQWRYYQQKGAAVMGLCLFDVDDGMVENVLNERAERYSGKASKKAVAAPEAAEPAIEEPAPAPAADSVAAKAAAIENWSEFRSFAREYLGTPLPRSRSGIMDALSELD